MKKVLKLMLAVLMTISLAACSGGNSTEEQEKVVENFFTYVSECKFDELAEITDDSVIDTMGITAMEASLNMYDDPDTYGKVFIDETEEYKKAVFKDLFTDIKITNAEIEGDETTVTVSGKYMNYNSIDLSSVDIDAIAEEYVNANSTELMQTYQNEGYNAYQIKIYDNIAPVYYDQMKELLKQAESSDFDGKFVLENKDDQWIITSVQ